MKTDHIYTSYTDFLKDRKFIQWQLMPDEELDCYWEEFSRQHPELRQELRQAADYLKNEGLGKSGFDENEHAELLERIRRTIRQTNKTRRRRALWYVPASAAAVALAFIVVTLLTPPPDRHVTAGEELIVGELLNNEDIQLITGGEAISFQDDVEVTLNEEGTAEIVQANREATTIEIDRDQLHSLVVPYGKRSMLTLADGSRVWLNSGSVLEFPAQFNGDRREIRLISGEMYAEAAHDKEKPFLVRAGDFNVKVYGTKFNISAYAGSPQSVVLVEGSVSLQSEGNKELFIAPSEIAVYTGEGTFDTQRVDASRFISWKEGYLSFEKTPMTEVLRQLGRYYNLSFDFGNDVNLQKRTCTGKIHLSENLDNVMTTVALLSSTKYDKHENRIYITNQPE